MIVLFLPACRVDDEPSAPAELPRKPLEAAEVLGCDEPPDLPSPMDPLKRSDRFDP